MDKYVEVAFECEGEDVTYSIQIPGIPDNERLTPKMAIQAALIVCGHRSGITVMDRETAYRVYRNSYRKLPEPARIDGSQTE